MIPIGDKPLTIFVELERIVCAGDTVPAGDARDVLTALKDAGHQVFIVTSLDGDSAREIVEGYQLPYTAILPRCTEGCWLLLTAEPDGEPDMPKGLSIQAPVGGIGTLKQFLPSTAI